MKKLARDQFASFQLRLPLGWKAPSGDPDAAHYRDALKPEEKNTQGVMGQALVLPQSMVKAHTDAQKMVHAKFGSFMDGIMDAVQQGWQAWQLDAKMAGFVVTLNMVMGGVVASTVPLAQLILAAGPKSTPQELKYTKAVADVFATQMALYGLGLVIKPPGLPLLPGFIAPMPTGPALHPGPSMPMPLKMFSNASMVMSKNVTKPMMIAALGDPRAPMHVELFDAIAHSIEETHKTWELNTKISNVMPLAVAAGFPAGPVAGSAIMPPGGFV